LRTEQHPNFATARIVDLQNLKWTSGGPVLFNEEVGFYGKDGVVVGLLAAALLDVWAWPSSSRPVFGASLEKDNFVPTAKVLRCGKKLEQADEDLPGAFDEKPVFTAHFPPLSPSDRSAGDMVQIIR